jgi:hypothetical protein
MSGLEKQQELRRLSADQSHKTLRFQVACPDRSLLTNLN